jgi:hypothetical protein
VQGRAGGRIVWRQVECAEVEQLAGVVAGRCHQAAIALGACGQAHQHGVATVVAGRQGWRAWRKPGSVGTKTSGRRFGAKNAHMRALPATHATARAP